MQVYLPIAYTYINNELNLRIEDDWLREELHEFEEIVLQDHTDKERLEDEFGDLLFSLVNLSRYIQVDPENALERTNKKFISRFSYIEKRANDLGKNLKDMSLAEMDELWNEAKKINSR